MESREMIARINRIERMLGLLPMPTVSPEKIKEYREKTGCSFEHAKNVVTSHEIAALFMEEK